MAIHDTYQRPLVDVSNQWNVVLIWMMASSWSQEERVMKCLVWNGGGLLHKDPWRVIECPRITNWHIRLNPKHAVLLPLLIWIIVGSKRHYHHADHAIDPMMVLRSHVHPRHKDFGIRPRACPSRTFSTSAMYHNPKAYRNLISIWIPSLFLYPSTRPTKSTCMFDTRSRWLSISPINLLPAATTQRMDEDDGWMDWIIKDWLMLEAVHKLI